MTTANHSVALLFGGQSAEHEVSLVSAGNVRRALKEAGYRVVLIGIDRQGRWFLTDDIASPAELPEERRRPVTLAPGRGGALFALDASGDGPGEPLETVDVVFPVLHGPFGEDGTVQGLLKLAQVAFVGPGVLGSAVAMDKDVAKRLLRDAGVPIVEFLTYAAGETPDFDAVAKTLGTPLFVKPANMGSSVGVSKVADRAAFDAAVATAFRYDHRILVEQNAGGREVECAVLTDDEDRASLPGEIVPGGPDGFYSYDAKYVAEDDAALHAPADLPAALVARVQALALAACAALKCEGMARVDFFLKEDGELLVNEVNTIPGFTAISMYPKLWEVSGVPPAELVRLLVEHAQRRFAREQELETHR